MALAAAAVLGTAGVAYAVALDIATLNTAGVTHNVAAGDTMTGDGTLTVGLNLANPLQITVDTDKNITLAPRALQKIDGTSAITKGGNGTLTFIGANGGNPDTTVQSTFTGNVFVNDGILEVRHSNTLGQSALVVMQANNSLDDTNVVFAVREKDFSFGAATGAPALDSARAMVLSADDGVVAVNQYPVVLDVEKTASDVNLRFYSRLTEAGADQATVVKENAGKVYFDFLGTTHQGGTVLNGGTIEMFSDKSVRMDGQLGETYVASPDETTVPYDDNLLPLTGKDNFFRSAAGTLLHTRTDQFFYAFDGAGAVQGAYKNGNVTPVITTWLNNNGTTNSTYTGPITGNLHLRLDAGKDAARPLQTLRLTGANGWNGETWVADGILSALNVGSIGTSTIRVGVDSDDNTGGNGLADELYDTQGRATLHFTADSVVPNKTVTENGAGLGVDDRAMVTYRDVAVFNDLTINPWLNVTETAPQNYLGTVRFDNAIDYAGTITDPTNITVQRGRLQLWANPAAAGDFAKIEVKENARLGFGPTVQDMLTVYDVIMNDASSLEGYVTPNNVLTTKNFDDLYNKAIMRFNGFNADALGRDITDANKYIKIKLTLDNVTTIKKGSYIPLVSARNFIGQPALYDVPTDTHKVRVYIDNLPNNNLPTNYLAVDTKTYDGVIYAEVVKDIAPVQSEDKSEDPKPVDGGSSGCSTGAFASFAGLLLAPLALLRKKD